MPKDKQKNAQLLQPMRRRVYKAAVIGRPGHVISGGRSGRRSGQALSLPHTSAETSQHVRTASEK